MKSDKKEIIDALNTSLKTLQQGIDHHCCLVSAILQEGVDERNLPTVLFHCPKRAREARLEKAIQEAIDTIEDTRKAFKSKQLEALRKKLTAVLIASE